MEKFHYHKNGSGLMILIYMNGKPMNSTTLCESLMEIEALVWKLGRCEVKV